MKIRNETEAPVVGFVPATVRDPALLEIACPFGCVEITPTGRRKKNGTARIHTHGAGPLGANHRTYLGHRVAHCFESLGRGYEITDPHGLVPARSTAAAS